MTASQLKNRIRSIADLPGKSVATWAEEVGTPQGSARLAAPPGWPWPSSGAHDALCTRDPPSTQSYLEYLARHNVKALGMKWDTDEDVELMLDAVRAGEVQAVVLEG